MNTMTYSDAGLEMTKGFEGLRLEAYKDVAGVWTIGYGHTGPDVTPGLEITEEQATALLLEDLQKAVSFVNAAVKVALAQGQFDALVDFAFNCGCEALAGSTLLRKVNAGFFAAAAAQFGLWVHAGGQVVAGLVRRRRDEAALFAGTAAALP